jgi:hypothetical protein
MPRRDSGFRGGGKGDMVSVVLSPWRVTGRSGRFGFSLR